jgi:GxxExxY protein
MNAEKIQNEAAINDLTYKIIGCIYKVHSALGPGLFESSYEVCLVHELINAGLKVEAQKALPVIYNGLKLDAGYKVDLIVEGCVIIELKSVESINDIHKAQILTYLKLSCIEVGLLVNFNVKDMKKGVSRLASSRNKK